MDIQSLRNMSAYSGAYRTSLNASGGGPRPNVPASSDANSTAPFFEKEAAPPSVGFGEGTVSTNGAAVDAVRRNFSQIRQTLPSAEELREETRTRFRLEREMRRVEDQVRLEQAREVAVDQTVQTRAAVNAFSEASQSTSATPEPRENTPVPVQGAEGFDATA